MKFHLTILVGVNFRQNLGQFFSTNVFIVFLKVKKIA